MIEEVAYILFRHWRDDKEHDSTSRLAWEGFDYKIKRTWYEQAKKVVAYIKDHTDDT